MKSIKMLLCVSYLHLLYGRCSAMTPHGFLNLHKPVGMTSRAVVDWVHERLGGSVKVGHTGTLDPLAEGVIVLAVGQAVRFIEFIQNVRKTYRSTFHLGETSSTDDAEGERTPFPEARVPEEETVRQMLPRFVGDLEQVPPQYSAIKRDGQRAYHQARQGKTLAMEPRTVRVERLTLLRYHYPRLEVEIVCGKGTYVRSLARDIGQALGCGGYVACLMRTQIGPFTAQHSLSLTSEPSANLIDQLIPMTCLAEMYPSFHCPADLVRRVRFGQRIQGPSLPPRETTGLKAILDEANQFVAMATWLADRQFLIPERVWQQNPD